jgi:hypothetical protein
MPACYFCGEDRPLTREHIFGDWLAEPITSRSERRAHTIKKPSRGPLTLDPAELVETARFNQNGDPLRFAFKMLCLDCNGKSLSRYHDEARPIILRLLGGDWSPIAPADCLSLAKWAVMVTIAWEWREPSSAAVSLGDRRMLLAGVIPPRWLVAVGRGSIEAGAYIFHRAIVAMDDDEPLNITEEERRGQRTAFVIGDLLIITQSANSLVLEQSLLPDTLRSSYFRTYGLREIYPLTSQSAAVPRLYNTAAIEAFMDMLGRPGMSWDLPPV